MAACATVPSLNLGGGRTVVPDGYEQLRYRKGLRRKDCCLELDGSGVKFSRKHGYEIITAALPSPPPRVERKDGAVKGTGTSSKMVPIEQVLKRKSLLDSKGSVNGNGLGNEGYGELNSRKIANGRAEPSRVTNLENKSADRSKGTIIASRSGLSVNGVGISRELIRKKLLVPTVVLPQVEETLRVLPSDTNFSWSKENYSSVQRTIDVWSFVLALRVRVFLLDAKWTYIGGFSEEKQKARRRKTAMWVRETILQLGPTFIKLGQLSSTRSDLFPAEFVEELAKLQDRVPAFTAEKSMKFIEKELGSPVEKLFVQFERQPIAAASLGQVHRAVLPTGETVVVKVQRPGLKALFDIDLMNLKRIAEYFQNSETMGGPTRDWLGIYEECATILYQEIDYINEGRNADKFRRDFRKVKWVRVPKIFWDYTSLKVLTLEYAPGIKINNVQALDAGKFDRSHIASRAIEAYLIQILKTGFFHADPHPGNLAIDVDGTLIYYDFGMMGEIKPFTRAKLLEMFYAVYEKDAKKILQALVDLGALVPTGDMTSVRKSIQFFLDNLMNQRPDQATTLSAIGEDLFAIALDQPFRFPATFTFVLRAFSTLEGIGSTLDPNFSFAKIAAPFAQELLDVRDKKSNGQHLVEQFQRQAVDATDAALAMPSRIQRMDDIIKSLESGDIKLRVRVLEAERAARRASIQQDATINMVAAACLLNVGVSLSLSHGASVLSSAPFVGAGIFFILFLNSTRRIKNLDKFEKMI